MFAIGFICMFLLAFFESSNMKKIALTSEVKNLLTSLMLLVGAVSSFIGFLIMSHINNESSIEIIKSNEVLTDYKYYMILVSEFLGFYLARKNYIENGDNMIAINFMLFLSIIIVPTYSILFSDMLGFTNDIKIQYNNWGEFGFFIIAMFTLSVLYFFDKVKSSKVNNIKILLLLVLVLSNSMFMTGKLMQEYNAFLTYSHISIMLSFMFFVIALKDKEIKSFSFDKHKKTMTFIVLTWSVAIPLNTIAIKFLAIEFVTLLKRISQIVSGYILDKIHKNNVEMKPKDYVIIGLMILVGFIFQYTRT